MPVSTAIVHCPSCKKTFKTRSRLNVHIALAPNCKWVRTMCSCQNDVEMRDYRELGDQDDDHLGNRDGGDVDEAELDEIEVLQHKAGSPSRASAGLSHQAKRNDYGDPILVVERHPEAGRVLRCDVATHATYMRTCRDLQSEDNQYHPFLDEGDYEVARWAIEQGPSQNALTDFLSIDKASALQLHLCLILTSMLGDQ